MKIVFVSAIIISTAIGCSNNTSTTSIAPLTDTTAITENKKDTFLPVTAFIKGQMLVLDSLPITPLHTIIVNNKHDSVWLKKNELIPLLTDFLTPEIKETNFTNFFRQTSFNDQTLNAITFTYDPVTALPDSISLRHWDIYIDPASGNISKVYLVKQSKEKEGIITKQLTWKTNKWAMITTLLNKPDGNTQILKEEKFTWNFNE